MPFQPLVGVVAVGGCVDRTDGVGAAAEVVSLLSGNRACVGGSRGVACICLPEKVQEGLLTRGDFCYF